MQSVERMLSELRTRAAELARPDEAVELGSLTVSRFDTSEPEHQLSSPLFILMVQGGKRIFLGERVFEYVAGEGLIVSAALPLSGYFIDATPARPALAVSMRLDPTAIAAVLSRSNGSRPAADETDAAIGTLTASPELLDAVLRLFRLQDAPEDAPVLAPLVEREIVWRLLTGPLGDVVAQLGLPQGGHARIGEAITWLRDNLAEPMAVPQLARIAGMSASTFHRRFRTMTGLSPLQFQKRLRLQEARSLLVADTLTITDVAFSVGYSSASQFSREYCTLFGLPPRRDAARLRSLSGTLRR